MSEEFYQMDAEKGSANTSFGKLRKFLCPTYGEIESFISSTIKGYEGNWCQLCWLEAMERIGVNRVTEIKD